MNRSQVRAIISFLFVLAAIGMVGCVNSENFNPRPVSGFAPAMHYSTEAIIPVAESTSAHLDFPGTNSAQAYEGNISRLSIREPATIDASRLQWELLSQFEIREDQVEFSDQHYIIPSETWLRTTFIPYALKYLNSHQLIGDGEGRDCDNIGLTFRHLLVLSNAQSLGTAFGDVPCAILTTRQKNEFGGIKGDGTRHSLILMRTNTGWLVVEPQTGQTSPFEHYPNRQETSWVLL